MYLDANRGESPLSHTEEYKDPSGIQVRVSQEISSKTREEIQRESLGMGSSLVEDCDYSEFEDELLWVKNNASNVLNLLLLSISLRLIF